MKLGGRGGMLTLDPFSPEPGTPRSYKADFVEQKMTHNASI